MSIHEATQEALAAQKRQSVKETREKLELAVGMLRAGQCQDHRRRRAGLGGLDPDVCRRDILEFGEVEDFGVVDHFASQLVVPRRTRATNCEEGRPVPGRCWVALTRWRPG